MSTVKADNFTWKTGEATAQVGSSVTGPQIVYGVSKCWANFTAPGSITVNKSFNVSSITYTGTGNYSLNFTTAQADSNFSFIGTSEPGSTANYTVIGRNTSVALSRSSTSMQICTIYISSTAADGTAFNSLSINVAFFR